MSNLCAFPGCLHRCCSKKKAVLDFESGFVHQFRSHDLPQIPVWSVLRAEARLDFTLLRPHREFTAFCAGRVQRMSWRAEDRKRLDSRSPLCPAYADRVALPNLSLKERGVELKGRRKEIMTEDLQLTCSDCGREFTFSSEDQAFFQERGYSTPKRCKARHAAQMGP